MTSNRWCGLFVFVTGLACLLMGASRAGVPSAGIASTEGWRVDVCMAGSAELQLLPRIGPVLADRIMAWRVKRHVEAENQEPLDGLLAIQGIGPHTIEQLRPFVRRDVCSEPGLCTTADEFK